MMMSHSRALRHERLFKSAARLRGVDPVADDWHRGDQPWLAESLAQRGDGDTDGVGEGVGVLVPGPFQQLFGADDTTLGGDEHFEHGELFASERDVTSVAKNLPAEGIQPQTRDLTDRRPRVRPPAVQRPQPHDELPKLERFGEIVTGAELDPGSLVIDPGGGGEYEDRNAATGGDDPPGDLVPGGTGDVAIQDRESVGVDAEQFQRGVTVTGDVGGDRLQPKTVPDGFGQVGLILHDQHTHNLEPTQHGISPTYANRHSHGTVSTARWPRPARIS